MGNDMMIKSDEVNYEIEILPKVVVQMVDKPSLWTRIGLFIWFGLRVRRIQKT